MALQPSQLPIRNSLLLLLPLLLLLLPPLRCFLVATHGIRYVTELIADKEQAFLATVYALAVLGLAALLLKNIQEIVRYCILAPLCSLWRQVRAHPWLDGVLVLLLVAAFAPGIGRELAMHVDQHLAHRTGGGAAADGDDVDYVWRIIGWVLLASSGHLAAVWFTLQLLQRLLLVATTGS